MGPKSRFLSRRQVLQGIGGAAIGASTNWGAALNGLYPQQAKIPDKDPNIQPPTDPSQWPQWREELIAWRDKAKTALRYDGSTYADPNFTWASKCYSCAMVMTWDQAFLHGETGEYKVAELLKDGQARFGGYDGAVLWHAYPRIGFDFRNQFDYYRQLPQGLHGLGGVVSSFNQAGVQVFLDYNPWDTGTSRDAGADDTILAAILRASQANGIFLDTLAGESDQFRNHIDLGKVGVGFETEEACPIDRIGVHHLSWGQWFDTGEAPVLLRNRWFEQRHMMHMINRWDLDHSDELHIAWMNGAGMLIWENVFGSWVGWSDANRNLLKTMLPIQRAFHDHFSAGNWTPLVEPQTKGVYASLWEKDGVRLWTVVNRTTKDIDGPWFDAKAASGDQLYDLTTGAALTAAKGPIVARGIAAVALIPSGKLSPAATEFLTMQKSANRSAVQSIPPSITIAPPAGKSGNSGHASPNLVVVPAGNYKVVSHFRRRECGERGYMPPPQPGPPPLHQPIEEVRTLQMPSFGVAKAEVTNGEFMQFLRETEYQPATIENFLAHWDDGKIPPGMEHQPVVYVDLNDAQAYAKWRKLRLPTDAEWQIAMENNGFPRLKPEVWNLTSEEYTDGHTRFLILKGGSNYQAKGSDWYADGDIRTPDFAAKFIRIWPGLDRSPTIGFRCACTIA